MSDTVNQYIDFSSPEVAEQILDNVDLRKLPVGSDAFKAAAQDMLSKKNTDEPSDIDAPAGEDTDDTSDEEDSEEATDAKPSKKGKGLQHRIDELVREKAELKRRLEQQENAKNSAPAEHRTAANTTETEFNQPKPAFADYDSLEDYTEALTDWKIDKKMFDQEQQAIARQRQATVETVKNTWEEREKEVVKALPDYSKFVTVENLRAINPSNEVRAFLADSEVGPQTLYTLLSEDDMLDAYLNASPTRQLILLGKIEERFLNDDAAPVEKKATITKAPAPARNLPKGKVSASTVKDIYDPSLSFEEFDQAMRERERRRKMK